MGIFFWENAQAHNLESYLILYQILCYLGGAGCTKKKKKSNLESSINDVSNEEGSNIDKICRRIGFKERPMFQSKKWSSILWMVHRPKIPTDSYLKDWIRKSLLAHAKIKFERPWLFLIWRSLCKKVSRIKNCVFAFDVCHSHLLISN